jgi:Xaa-Pro aminopeptidase
MSAAVGTLDGVVKDETLQKVNDLLAELAKEAGPDGTVRRAPALVAEQVGLRTGLETARAMRALLARKRIENDDSGYRIISTDPIQPGEPLAIVPQRRKRPVADRGEEPDRSVPPAPSYSDIGRAVIDRLVELTREVGELRAGRGTEERARMEAAERRAGAAEQRAKELEVKLDMAEANLREVLRAAQMARGTGGSSITDPEAAAVLRFLQSGGDAETE